MRLEVLTVDKATGCWSHISVTISVESRFAEICSHGAIRQQPSFELEPFHLLLDTLLFFPGQFSDQSICTNSGLPDIRSISCSSCSTLFHRHICVQVRTTFSFAFRLISRCSRCNSFIRKAHLAKLGLNKLPLELHRGNQRSFLSSLVYASLLFNRLIENLWSFSEDPKSALFLVEVWVHGSFIRANGCFPSCG